MVNALMLRALHTFALLRVMRVRNLLRSPLASFLWDTFSFLELHLYHTIPLLKGFQPSFHSIYAASRSFSSPKTMQGAPSSTLINLTHQDVIKY